MTEHHYHFIYQVYGSEIELQADDALLLQHARAATKNAYAPYSKFLVGSAAKLANSQIITGSNQENASYPAGICAERVLLSAVASVYPRTAIHSMAVSYNNTVGNSSNPITPCGICRQSLMEQEAYSGHPIRLILAGLSGQVYVIPAASLLLPLAFNSKYLAKNTL